MYMDKVVPDSIHMSGNRRRVRDGNVIDKMFIGDKVKIAGDGEMVGSVHTEMSKPDG